MTLAVVLMTASGAPWVSLPERSFVAPGEGAHALGYEPTPAVVYVTGDGVTLRASCSIFGGPTHSAEGCSTLVPFDEVDVEAWPDEGEVDAAFFTVQQDFEPYNAVFTTARPPDWVPYTMMVLGADAGVLGNNGICGISDPVCDGLVRRGIGFLFAGPNCSTSPTRFISNNLARGWGLESVDAPQDLVYDGIPNTSAEFRDECFTLRNSSGSKNNCDYVHEQYCDEGQQNSHRELLGLLGPREVDEQPPAIVAIFPEDGANIEADEAIVITAEVEENSNFIAARWSFSGGGEDIDRCTNGLCDLDYDVPLGTAIERLNWDFLELDGAPLGEYVLTFEVADAYGGSDSRTVTFNIVEPGFNDSGSSSGSDSDSDSGDGSTSMNGDSTTTTTTGDGSAGDFATEGGSDDTGEATATAAAADDAEAGCGCRSGGGAGGLLTWGVFALLRRRRNRPRTRRTKAGLRTSGSCGLGGHP